MKKRLQRVFVCGLLCALLAASVPAPASAAGFDDVPAGHWAADAIDRAVDLGNIDSLLAVGELAWNIYDAAREKGMAGALYAKDRNTAKEILPNFIRPGAVILVKASRGMAFEEITRELQRLAPKD